jgi:predicted CoA-substrate-specific enzyme activase
MILGCDIGTGFTKAVVLQDGEFVFGTRIETQARPDRAMELAMENITAEKGIKADDFDDIVVTGWGQGKASAKCETYKTAAMIKCLARAAIWAEPACRSVLCMGTQQSVALSVNDKGKVLRYMMNDKCASGAGMFLQVILEALGCSVEECAEIAGSADKKLSMSSQCAVFAESEVVSLINDGESSANIVSAILDSLSKNVASLCKKVNARDALVLGGGLANNARIFELLQGGLRKKLYVFRPEPDLIAAVGAALSANGGTT